MTHLTILCENTAGPAVGVLGEHGFSVLIERAGDCFLFDTGQGHTILHNAGCLKKDLSRIKKILLSHGHYDHTGGLKQVLQQTGPVDVHAHPAIFTERFAALTKDHETSYRHVGIPAERAGLEALGARFVFNTSFAEITKGLYLTGEAPRTASFEKNDRRLVIRDKGRYAQDTIPDDQSLVLESAGGLAVILGCAHSGVINTLNHITAQLPGRPIHTVIGGTHMGFLSQAQLETTIEHLKKFPLKKIGVSHCTGLAPSMKLMQAFGQTFFFANAGSIVDLA
ncbi:MAG: MBL fold metallo-hydrolase [Deltaproteobacteria bacterium]|nr:MBL fold metallo-hydrolase [Deltaproteobacteria bacterium]